MYEIENIVELISFYKTRGSFLNLRNCGVIINKELTELCEYYGSVIELDPKDSKRPIRYADLESGQKALERSHINVLVVVANKDAVGQDKLSELGENVGWCAI